MQCIAMYKVMPDALVHTDSWSLGCCLADSLQQTVAIPHTNAVWCRSPLFLSCSVQVWLPPATDFQWQMRHSNDVKCN